MSEIQSIVNSLLARAASVDPVMLSILQEILDELNRIGLLVDPAPTVQKKVSTVTVATPTEVGDIAYTLTATNVVLSWDPSSQGFIFYEVRRGSTWDTASRVTVTSNNGIILDPLPVGSTTFLVRSLSTSGVYSNTISSVDVVIPEIGNPGITADVINNFTTLLWTEPTTTFRIEHYEITRNGSELAPNVKGLFYVHQEAAAGTITFGVKAVDIAGNTGPESTITVDVGAPTDFVIEDTQQSTFTGTFVNGMVDNNIAYFNIDLTTSYEDHFIDNTWASPQDQVDDGYEYWIQPTLPTGSYEEIFDFGSIYTNIIVNVSWLFDVIVGNFTFGLDIRVSDDNISYSSAFTTPSFFASSARYVKVKFTFTNGDDKGILAFSNFIVNILVKRENDGGHTEVFAADASGTTILFNKAFKFVESISVTPLDPFDRSATYNFAGGANPTSFTVKLYDNTGIRVDGTVGWFVRGII